MIKKLIAKTRDYLIAPLIEHMLTNRQSDVTTVIEQQILKSLYFQLYHSKSLPLALKDVGFRVHSQNEEDGIILFIFSLLGTTNKKCVEICSGDGVECNTANLIINHRWIGLLCDGEGSNIEKAKKFYSAHPDTKYWPPTIVKKWVTKDNINNIIQESGFCGEIDLLSLDVDGVDYWLWREISCISPRVVVLEFNHLWGPDASVTVPYRHDFVAEFTQYGSDYAGGSLRAFVNLSKKKGYRLVGTNAIATNAFFVRNDISCHWLPEIEVSGCFEHPRAQFGRTHRLPGIQSKPWTEV